MGEGETAEVVDPAGAHGLARTGWTSPRFVGKSKLRYTRTITNPLVLRIQTPKAVSGAPTSYVCGAHWVRRDNQVAKIVLALRQLVNQLGECVLASFGELSETIAEFALMTKSGPVIDGVFRHFVPQVKVQSGWWFGGEYPIRQVCARRCKYHRQHVVYGCWSES